MCGTATARRRGRSWARPGGAGSSATARWQCSSLRASGSAPAGASVRPTFEDDVDEVADAAAVLFAGGEQGGDGPVPLLVGERPVVEEGGGEVADGAAHLVEGEWGVHQKLHPVVGRVAGSMPTPW